MIDTYLLNGKCEHLTFDTLEPIETSLHAQLDFIQSVPQEVLVHLVSQLSEEILHEPSFRTIPGIGFLMAWLKKQNLQDLITSNLQGYSFEKFILAPPRLQVRLQPRGVVVHWVAGNVPTLSLFSLVQSLLCKNANILRVPQHNANLVAQLLEKLSRVQTEFEGKQYYGKDILKSIVVLYFPSSDVDLNISLSLLADCKVMWGGGNAIEAIRKYPQQEHCEQIIFGPKYSFCVIDSASLSDEKIYDQIVLDAILFEQTACSSPHVVFIEKSNHPIKIYAQRLSAAFERLSTRYPKGAMLPYTATRILNARAEFLLYEEKDVLASKDLTWTVLIGGEFELPVGIQSRTLYLKETNSVIDVIPLITSKVQTVGIAIQDPVTRENFCTQVTRKGVSRCVPIGKMHSYDSPWDGMYMMQRLVRYCTMKSGD
jgi:hypothetical protein